MKPKRTSRRKRDWDSQSQSSMPRNTRPNKDRPKKPAPPRFSLTDPTLWNQWINKTIPDFVKTQYSPKASWKDKPFSTADAQFFFKGISELSNLFTQERKKLIEYGNHPRLRSAYLLYFLPLQTAKFLSLFQQHPEALKSIEERLEKGEPISILDLGSGPGTASFALLLWILGNQKTKVGRIDLRLHWVDTNASFLKEGALLLREFCSWVDPECHFDWRTSGRLTEEQSRKLQRAKKEASFCIELHTQPSPWWKTPTEQIQSSHFTFMGHVLNEHSSRFSAEKKRVWEALAQPREGAGTLIVEPAQCQSAQSLSVLRDQLFEDELLERDPQRLWGPCLHSQKCPLSQGKDWCHFSVPTQLPGQWFKRFSQGLGSERQWLKYSYLWITSVKDPRPQPDQDVRRVVSDPLFEKNSKGKGGPQTVLLCEPEQVRRWRKPKDRNIHRGDLVFLEAQRLPKPRT